ncbi:helix-turn-helix domain-containing protein [Rhodobacterales bacterium HKCCE4037]|nr:helix-turn-helix domain-containing protein [Rhodobacterales bacterium HKCCE4037]
MSKLMSAPISAPVPPLQRFSTAFLPAPDRLAIWREVFGREVIRLDMAPLGDAPMHYEARFLPVHRTTIGIGSASAMSCERTRPLLSDGNDDIILLLPIMGSVSLEQRGAEIVARSGDILVRRSDDAGKTLSSSGQFLTLTLPVRELESRVADIDRLTMAVLPRDGEGVRLLTRYARMILSDPEIGPAVSKVIQSHLADLVAVAIGANRAAWHEAQQRGFRAARLRAIHAAIREGAAEEGLSINAVARTMGISPGYIRKLLAAEGTNFSALVLERRLHLAHAALSDPALARRPISAIALDCGFGDVSYFNRAFRKRFDATPGDVRAAARHP